MLSEKIKKLRTRRNLQQKDLISYLKIAKSTYSQYESGDRVPSIDIIKKLAEFYNVSLDYLLDYEIEEISEEQTEYKVDKDLVKAELGDVGVLFYDSSKITPEQLKFLKTVAKSMNEDDDD